MNEFHQQAVHNKDFLDCIEKNYSNKFYDWKITVVFYISIHLLKALGKKRGKDIGSSHHAIFGNFDKSRTTKPLFVIPEEVWTTYKRIYKYSKSSRYDGISDLSITELALQKDYGEVVKLQSDFCKYMSSQHLPV
ncbi:MAG: hypothetical protein JWR54_3420 [Mucilaginibacter sp.]|nr:hypothetical protein [Mucilaginibacter sp.]